MIRPGSAPVHEGDLLAGKYRVERVLGAGGMGIVVAARHIELDQLVAIKFVRDEALDNEQGVQRFLREARAAVKLKSEHVARVLDVGKLESGAPYMVMEYLEGSDLGTVLTDRGPLPVEHAAEWIMQACEAVAEAHAAGIVHRDLKPENLFLTRAVGGAAKVKVLDFGVSKAIQGPSSDLSGLTRTRAMLGSPLYMAPEQMRSSRDVDARADIWALGVVLFQLLTLRWPFEASSMPELCLKVVTDPPLSLASLRPDIPEALVAVIERCLSKDPANRYAQAAELASALEPFVQPASRIFAERARFAMASSVRGTGGAASLGRAGSGGGAASSVGEGSSGGARSVGSGNGNGEVVSLPGSTQVSGGSGSGSAAQRLGVNTPGTSAAWGAAVGSAPPASKRGRGIALIVGVCVASAAVCIAVLTFALRRPTTEAVAATGPVSASLASERPDLPQVPERPTPEAMPVAAAPSSSAPVQALPVPVASTGSPAVMHGVPQAAPPPPKPPTPPGRTVTIPPSHQATPQASARPAEDQDIPTIR